MGIISRDMLKDAQGRLTPQETESLMTLEGSRSLASEVFIDAGLKEIAHGMGVSNPRGIETKRIVVDRWPGAMIEFVGEQQRLDVILTAYNRIYVVIYKNYMVFVHCSILRYKNETNISFEQQMQLMIPLFQLVANSIVIQSQYRR
jgi:hypothetical protein